MLVLVIFLMKVLFDRSKKIKDKNIWTESLIQKFLYCGVPKVKLWRPEIRGSHPFICWMHILCVHNWWISMNNSYTKSNVLGWCKCGTVNKRPITVNYRLITAYLLLRVNLDKIMHAHWDFDASSARTRRVSALDKHQNWSASALFCLNSRA